MSHYILWRKVLAGALLMALSSLFWWPVTLPRQIDTWVHWQPSRGWMVALQRDGRVVSYSFDLKRGVWHMERQLFPQRGDVWQWRVPDSLYQGVSICAGQRILSLESVQLERELHDVASRLALAWAQLEVARTGAKPEQVRQAQKEEEIAASQLALAQKQWRRAAALFGDSLLPMAELEVYAQAVEVAKKRYERAQSRVADLQTGVKVPQQAYLRQQIAQWATQQQVLLEQKAALQWQAPLSGILRIEVRTQEWQYWVEDTTNWVGRVGLPLSLAQDIHVGDTLWLQYSDGRIAVRVLPQPPDVIWRQEQVQPWIVVQPLSSAAIATWPRWQAVRLTVDTLTLKDYIFRAGVASY